MKYFILLILLAQSGFSAELKNVCATGTRDYDSDVLVDAGITAMAGRGRVTVALCDQSFDSQVDWGGQTGADANNYFYLTKQNGVPQWGARKNVNSGSGAMLMKSPYMQVHGLKITSNANYGQGSISMSSSASNNVINGCWIISNASTGNTGIIWPGTQATGLTVSNTYIQGIGTKGSGWGIYQSGNFYNVLVEGFANGMRDGTYKNCASKNNTTSFTNAGGTSNYNASSTATVPGANSLANVTNWDLTNYAMTTSSATYNVGTNLSGSGVTKDINCNTWTNWSIGTNDPSVAGERCTDTTISPYADPDSVRQDSAYVAPNNKYKQIIDSLGGAFAHYTGDTTSWGKLVDRIGWRNCTITSTTISTGSKNSDKYANFTASGGVARCGDNAYIDSTTKVSASVLFRATSLDTGMTIFTKDDGAKHEYTLRLSNDTVKFAVDSAWLNVNLPNHIRLRKWIHIVTVFDGTLSAAERLKLYVNGDSFKVNYTKNPPATTYYGNDTALYLAKGGRSKIYIDDIAFFRSALTKDAARRMFRAVFRPNKVMILGGQSNGIGNDKTAGYTAGVDSTFGWRTNGFDSLSGATDSLASNYQEADSNNISYQGASLAAPFANALVGNYGSVGIVSSGRVGTGISTFYLSRNASDLERYNTLHGNLLRKINITQPDAVIWWQGETDAGANMTRQKFYDTTLAFINQIRADAGYDIPWYIVQIGTVNNTAAYQRIRAAQADLCDSVSGVYCLGTAIPYPLLVDNIHTSRVGMDSLGKAAANAYLYGVPRVSSFKNPIINETLRSNIVDLIISGASNLRPVVSNALTRFYNTDLDTTIVPDSSRKISNTTIRYYLPSENATRAFYLVKGSSFVAQSDSAIYDDRGLPSYLLSGNGSITDGYYTFSSYVWPPVSGSRFSPLRRMGIAPR